MLNGGRNESKLNSADFIISNHEMVSSKRRTFQWLADCIIQGNLLLNLDLDSNSVKKNNEIFENKLKPTTKLNSFDVLLKSSQEIKDLEIQTQMETQNKKQTQFDEDFECQSSGNTIYYQSEFSEDSLFGYFGSICDGKID